MQAVVRLNTVSGKWEAVVGHRVLCKSVSKPYVVNMAKKQGHQIVEMDNPKASHVKMVEAKSEFSVDERFQFITQFVQLVARKTMPSLIITGAGGIGKTYTVVNTLKKMGKKEDTIGEINGDFVVIKGYSTPKGLYRSLWENNGKTIILDDCDNIFKDPIGSNVLKGALESEAKRVISWNAEFSEREELPNRFEFYGQVIFISNLDQQKFPQALLSRSMRVDLTLTTTEKVDRIETVLQNVEGEASDKKEVLEFVKKYADRATDLNIRSALSVLKLKVALGDNWERAALYNFTA